MSELFTDTLEKTAVNSAEVRLSRRAQKNEQQRGNAMKSKILGLLAVGLLAGPMTAQAAIVVVDCNKKASINVELAKLDKTVANVLRVGGSCQENVVIDGHRDLTILNVDVNRTAYEIRPASGRAVTVTGGSKVTFDNATIRPAAGAEGFLCERQSTCRFTRWVGFGVVESYTAGDLISVQSQSVVEMLNFDTQRLAGFYSGSRVIGVYGGSSANLSFSATSPGIFSSNSTAVEAVTVQDGSFLRIDNGVVRSNKVAVLVQRGAVAKLLDTEVSGNTISGTIGIRLLASSLQFEGASKIVGSSKPIVIGALGFLRAASYADTPVSLVSTTGEYGVDCTHSTAVAQLVNVDLGSAGTSCAGN